MPRVERNRRLVQNVSLGFWGEHPSARAASVPKLAKLEESRHESRDAHGHHLVASRCAWPVIDAAVQVARDRSDQSAQSGKKRWNRRP